MWDELKGISGFLFFVGCVITWISFLVPHINPTWIPDPYLLWQWGILLVGVGIGVFVSAWVLGKISFQRRPTYYHVVKGKRTTRRITKLIVGGLVLTIVAWGVVTYGPGVWEKIQNGTSGGGVISLEDICRYPNNYINENVIVEGQLVLNDGGLMDPYFENADASLFSMVFQVEINYPYHVWSIRFYGVSTNGLVVLDKIRLTGRIVELTPRYAENFFGNIIVIQASEIELIN